MNITLLVNRDLASCVALNHLLPQLASHRLYLFLSSRVGKSSTTKPELLNTLKFYEQDLFNDILFPLLDSNAALTKTATLKTFYGLQEFLAAPPAELNKINTDELTRFEATEPDLVLSIRYGVILKEQALAVPTLGVLNLHSGLLPDYRGVMASFWALLNNATTLGTTLHYIDDATIDTGRVLGTTALPRNPDRSYLWHVLTLYKDGCDLLAQKVAAIARGEQPACTAQSGQGNYYSYPRQEHLDQFGSQGSVLVDPAEIVGIASQFQNNL